MLEFIGLFMFGLLIFGLIKPQKVMFWSKKPSRLKFFGLWFLVIAIGNSIYTNFLETDESRLENAKKYISEETYSSALLYLERIEDGSKYSKEADSLISVVKKEILKNSSKNSAKNSPSQEKQSSSTTSYSYKRKCNWCSQTYNSKDGWTSALRMINKSEVGVYCSRKCATEYLRSN